MERQWRAIERRALPNGVWTTRERGTCCLFVRPIASEKKSMVVGGKGEDRKRHGGRKGEGASLLPSPPYDDDTQA
jgi:hypothetical protein